MGGEDGEARHGRGELDGEVKHGKGEEDGEAGVREGGGGQVRDTAGAGHGLQQHPEGGGGHRGVIHGKKGMREKGGGQWQERRMTRDLKSQVSLGRCPTTHDSVM